VNAATAARAAPPAIPAPLLTPPLDAAMAGCVGGGIDVEGWDVGGAASVCWVC
jgi:hypothetical protein